MESLERDVNGVPIDNQHDFKARKRLGGAPRVIKNPNGSLELVGNHSLDVSEDDWGFEKDRGVAATGGKRSKYSLHGVLPPRASIRLFSLESNSVVRKRLFAKYGILSYTWGQRETPQAAITAAKATLERMGLKYLWIDQMCILQNDDVDKVREIPKMGQYYANAEVCIALIPELAKVNIPALATEDARETVSQVASYWAVVSSEWSSRVWTFQEKELSYDLLTLEGEGKSPGPM